MPSGINPNSSLVNSIQDESDENFKYATSSIENRRIITNKTKSKSDNDSNMI